MSLVGGSGRDLVSDGWIHCAFALVLYPAFCLFTLAAWRQRHDLSVAHRFFILCIACLYCTALLYSPLAVLCRALILSSRPMAITLLWVAVQRRSMGARGLPLVAGCGRCVCSSAVDCAIHTVELIGLSPGQMDSVVQRRHARHGLRHDAGDALWFVRLRPDGAEPASSNAAGAADVSEILAAMADARGLSEREGGGAPGCSIAATPRKRSPSACSFR